MKVYVVLSQADNCIYEYDSRAFQNREDAERVAADANIEWGVLDYFVQELELV